MSKTFYTQFLSNFSQLFESGKSFDLLLYAGSERDSNRKEFKVHTQILCAQSAYFQAALSKEWLKKAGDYYVFEKANIEADVFEIILRYLYTGEVNIEKCDGFQIVKLLVASDELGLVDLLQFAQSYLIESRQSFNVDQLVRILKLIFRLESCKTLRQLCLDAFCNDHAKLFGSDDYLTLEEDIFIQILRNENLRMKEVDLWKYVLKWGISRHPELKNSPAEWSTEGVNRMKKTLAPLIECIRFFAMSAEEYYDEVRPYKKLFSKKLREEMLQFIMLPSRKPSDIMTRTRLLNSTLISCSIAALIAGWIDSKIKTTSYDEIPYEFTLIYRASRDGFNDQKFRSMCSNKGPTVVIAKVLNQPYIFGGYNPSSWVGYNLVSAQCCNRGTNSFIFEIPDGKSTTGARIGRFRRENGYYADHHSSHGPRFGSNFCINGQAWSSNMSRNIGISRRWPSNTNTSICCTYGIACNVTRGTLEEYEQPMSIEFKILDNMVKRTLLEI
ncbi:10201_t:CDS:2 [Paraglomus occultum]|uniref:10201_t:CDS:1 n=1 Tax=Paraglomus occultum TaxID=144539 RepID=A0A9N9D6X2_9GLOM|nr:10201_t:CDS:2 [Paraglomus occultum]